MKTEPVMPQENKMAGKMQLCLRYEIPLDDCVERTTK